MILSPGNSEERLSRRLRGGDSAALQEFYSLYGDYLAGICSRYVTDRDDMQDVFQDCLVKVMTKIGSFEYRGPGSLLAWAKRIVVNRSLDFLKSCKRHEFTRLDRDIEDEAEEDDPPIRDIPPEVIHRMVSELPTGYRTVFNLYVFEDRSHKEIAQLLGIKPDSSASQLCKAKNMLARKIKEYYGQTGQGR